MDKNQYNIEVTRKNIKNMYLRVKSSDGTVLVSAPYRMSDARIKEFVESKSDWIEAAIARIRQMELKKAEAPVRK